MKKLQDYVGEYIDIKKDKNKESIEIDLSKLDFKNLKKFLRKKVMNKSVFDLKDAIDKKLKRMIQKNPERADFYKKYIKIITGI